MAPKKEQKKSKKIEKLNYARIILRKLLGFYKFKIEFKLRSVTDNFIALVN